MRSIVRWCRVLSASLDMRGGDVAAAPALRAGPCAGHRSGARDRRGRRAPAGPTTADLKIMADTVWVLVTGMLVFFMNLGFACVESGFCREKNCVNILSKNFIVFAISSIGFWLLGWGLMFGGGSEWIGTHGLWMVSGADNSPAMNDAYQGDYGSAQLDRRAAVGQVLLSARVLRYGRHDCVGRRGRADQVSFVHCLQLSSWPSRSIRWWAIGSGVVAGC